MHRSRLAACAFVWMVTIGGCIDINLPEDVSVFPEGTSFVLDGTAEASDAGDGCHEWRAADGRLFVLFQHPDLYSDTFDAITAPGTESRLLLTPRSDFGDPCSPGAFVAEVEEVLRVNGVNQPTPKEEAAARIQVRLDELKADLESTGEELRERAGEIRSGLESGVQDFINQLEEDVAAFAQELQARRDALDLPDADEVRAEAEEALRAFLNDIERRLGDAIDDATSGLEEFRESVRRAIEDLVDDAGSEADDRFEALRERVAQGLIELRPGLDEIEAWLDQVAEDLRVQFADDIDALRARIQAEMEASVAQIKDDIRERIDERLASFDPEGEEPAERLRQLLDLLGGEFDGLIDELAQAFRDQLAEIGGGLDELALRLLGIVRETP